MDRATVIDRIKQSDKPAFNELFRHYYKSLCRFAFVIVRCQQSAEEIVQDVFVKLWEKRERIHISANISSYLFVAVKNSSLNHVKLNHTRQQYEAETEQPETESTSFNSSNFAFHLQKAIEKLPERCRMIYHLKITEGLTCTEIASYLEISEKTAENQIHIAMVKLKHYLQPYRDTFYNQ